MKNLFVLFLLSISPFLYAQEYRLGLNSNYISSISEDVPEYTYYNPIEKTRLDNTQQAGKKFRSIWIKLYI